MSKRIEAVKQNLQCILIISAFALSLGGCAKASYCLRPGALPQGDIALSLGDKERIGMARELVRRLQSTQSPDAKATILTSLPSFLPSSVPECSTEYASLLRARYLQGARPGAWQVDQVTLAAIDALGILHGDASFRQLQGETLVRLYRKPLEDAPYLVLPHELGPYPKVLPGKDAIKLRIARVMAGTMSVYSSDMYRSFLLGDVALKAPNSVRLVLAPHIDVALGYASATPVQGVLRAQAVRVAQTWITQLKGSLNKPLSELDSLKLYVQMLNSLATHAASLGIQNDIEDLVSQMTRDLPASSLAQSMRATPDVLSRALSDAQRTLSDASLTRPETRQANVP